jgi:hypothetical protein
LKKKRRREREERRWLVGEEEEGEGRRGSYGLVPDWCDWHELRHMTLAREVKANARAAVYGFWETGEGGVARADSAQRGVRLRMANDLFERAIERCWIWSV